MCHLFVRRQSLICFLLSSLPPPLLYAALPPSQRPSPRALLPQNRLPLPLRYLLRSRLFYRRWSRPSHQLSCRRMVLLCFQRVNLPSSRHQRLPVSRQISLHCLRRGSLRSHRHQVLPVSRLPILPVSHRYCHLRSQVIGLLRRLRPARRQPPPPCRP